MANRSRYINAVQVRRTYHYIARPYDTMRFLWSLPLRKALDHAFEAHVSAGGQVLDLGCGTGANLERLLALRVPFDSYTGVDFSENMLAIAKAKFAHSEKVLFKQMDLSRDPLPEGPFDFIVCTWVLEHLPEPGRVMEKAWQRLVLGGHFALLFTTNEGWLNSFLTPALRLFKVRVLEGVDENVYRRFPGMVSLDHFLGGAVALAILHRTEKPGDSLAKGRT